MPKLLLACALLLDCRAGDLVYSENQTDGVTLGYGSALAGDYLVTLDLSGTATAKHIRTGAERKRATSSIGKSVDAAGVGTATTAYFSAVSAGNVAGTVGLGFPIFAVHVGSDLPSVVQLATSAQRVSLATSTDTLFVSSATGLLRVDDGDTLKSLVPRLANLPLAFGDGVLKVGDGARLRTLDPTTGAEDESKAVDVAGTIAQIAHIGDDLWLVTTGADSKQLGTLVHGKDKVEITLALASKSSIAWDGADLVYVCAFEAGWIGKLSRFSLADPTASKKLAGPNESDCPLFVAGAKLYYAGVGGVRRRDLASF